MPAHSLTDLKASERKSEIQRLTDLKLWACHSTHSSKLAEPGPGEIRSSLQLGENNRTHYLLLQTYDQQ